MGSVTGSLLTLVCLPHFRSMPSDLQFGPSAHSVLWNAMIHPLRNMTLKGVIWYQGECSVSWFSIVLLAVAT